jgi:hypothetical protein
VECWKYENVAGILSSVGIRASGTSLDIQQTCLDFCLPGKSTQMYKEPVLGERLKFHF